MSQINITELAKRVKLVSLNLGAWRPNKLNKAESAKVNAAHNVNDKARVIVKICDHPALAKLSKLHSEVYAIHTDLRFTMPSVQDGVRILVNGKEIEHTKMIADNEQKHNKLVAEFLAEYEVCRQNAPALLNGLYDAKQWPHKAIVASKFRFACRYLPCPTYGAWETWLEESATVATLELKDKLVETARHLATVCKGDGRIFESAVSNLKGLCELVGQGFNLLDDPIIQELASKLKAPASVNVDTLRDNEGFKRQTGQTIDAILAGCNATI